MLWKHLLVFGVALTLAGCHETGAEGHDHGHDHPAEGASALQLNDGKKWPTDESLRVGMTRIRGHLQADMKPIHEKTQSPDDYRALAANIEKELGDIVKNCSLPKEADDQLHLVLAQISSGTAKMKKDGDRQAGALAVVEGLDLYAKFFDHPGFEPLEH